MEDLLLAQVKDLVEQGFGKVIIARELGISEGRATRLIKKVREAGNEDSPADKLETIKLLLTQGLSYSEISKECNLPLKAVIYWADKIEDNRNRTNSIDKVRDLLDSGMDGYDVAQELNRSPRVIPSLVNKANGDFKPVKDWLVREAKTGVKLSKLKKYLQVESISKAEKILEENFPGCFVIKSKVEDGDTLLTPVVSSKSFLKRLDIDVDKRPFDVSIVDHNYIVVKVSETLPVNKLTIYDLTDIHVGAVKFRIKEFKRVIEHIKNDPTALVILGGDVIEALTKISVGDPNDQYESINDQVIEFIELILPIAHKVVCAIWGNHCGGRLEKAGQFDLARTIATMLKVPYCRERMIIDIHFKDQSKRISLAHKYGKALKMPQIEAAVEKIMSWSNFKIDCFFSGHTHESRAFAKNIKCIIPGIGLVTHRYFICNGGSFMGYSDTYASREDYPPTPQDTVYYWFDKDGNDGAGLLELNCD